MTSRCSIGQINGLAEREVQFVSLQEDLNTATPAGRLTFHFCGALAEFERDLIRERTVGINEICRIVGVGKTTLYHYLAPDGQCRGERLPDVAR